MMSGSTDSFANLPKKVALEARAAEPTTEIYLIDADLQLVDRSIGTLKTKQPPGAYKLKLRAGPAIYEEAVLLLNEPVIRELAPMQIASAAPVAQADTGHDFAAVKQGPQFHKSIGKGSSIFVVARDVMPDGQEQPEAKPHHPAQDLYLCGADGAEIVAFEQMSESQPAADPSAACRIELDPGPYRLMVRSVSGECYEMALHAPKGWHLEIFLLQRGYEKKSGRRANLASASIFLSRTAEFEPGSEQDRLVEAARVALASNRWVGEAAIEDMLWVKASNPMLGILGGHLLLLEPKPRLKLLQRVVTHLRRMLGNDHPDVEAIALGADLPTEHRFAHPPMLRASWNILVPHSIERPELVPPGSLSARIGTAISYQDPWLIWRKPDPELTVREVQQYGRDIADWLPTLGKRAATALLKSKDPSGSDVAAIASRLDLPSTTISELLPVARQFFKAGKAASSSKMASATPASAPKVAGSASKGSPRAVKSSGAAKPSTASSAVPQKAAKSSATAAPAPQSKSSAGPKGLRSSAKKAAPAKTKVASSAASAKATKPGATRSALSPKTSKTRAAGRKGSSKRVDQAAAE